MNVAMARVAWVVRAAPSEVVAHLRTAARPLGVAVELGEDQELHGANAGWLYAGNASGTPAGRMDVAEVRLSPAAESRTSLDLIRVDRPVPSRFEKQWSLHETRFKAPLLWGSLVTATRRRSPRGHPAAGILPVEPGHAE